MSEGHHGGQLSANVNINVPINVLAGRLFDHEKSACRVVVRVFLVPLLLIFAHLAHVDTHLAQLVRCERIPAGQCLHLALVQLFQSVDHGQVRVQSGSFIVLDRIEIDILAADDPCPYIGPGFHDSSLCGPQTGMSHEALRVHF